jgi:hypothetical protein
LDFSENLLSGTIPSLINCSRLTYLALNLNQLSGTLPEFSPYIRMEFFLVGMFLYQPARLNVIAR